MNLKYSPPPIHSPFEVSAGVVSSAWVEWLNSTFRQARKFQGSGTTADRPTNALEVGDWYFDTALTYPVWVASIGPVVWHNAAGTVV